MIRIALAALTVLVSSALPATSTSATTTAVQSVSSKALLLSPRMRPGESFTWIGRLVGAEEGTLAYNSGRSDVAHSDAITCGAMAVSESSLTLSRQFQDFVYGSLLREAGKDRGHWSRPSRRPPIVFIAGRAFATTGEPLADDPMCRFYSVAWFGIPPEHLAIGTSWHFSTPAWIPERPADMGTSTVTSLDSRKNILTLHVVLTRPEGNTIIEKFDMTIVDGGVIAVETQSNYEGTNVVPSEEDNWRLLAPGKDRLDLRRDFRQVVPVMGLSEITASRQAQQGLKTRGRFLRRLQE